ncbi:MAG: glycosyltransferase [bacterium]|nr:glycosyltransferase [bacterium]
MAMKYDYGRPEQGVSFEHANFFSTLECMGHDLIYFDFMTLLAKLGRDGMNRSLIRKVAEIRPDLMFCCLFSDQFDYKAIRSITESGIVTLNWFCDDHWRFDNFSRHWAHAFRWVATTDTWALPKYAGIGYNHALFTQWACNHYHYRRLNLPFEYDVSFVGMAHGDRPKLIARLRDAGIYVVTRGTGWPEDRVRQEEMIAIFNKSRINLNLSNASCRPSFWKRLWRGSRAQLQQIKGRNFEVTGCGGFLLTSPAERLDDFYIPNHEVVVFDNILDLIDKIHYYLGHDTERQAISEAGYNRTIREHTYEHRFTDLFKRMGLHI